MNNPFLEEDLRRTFGKFGKVVDIRHFKPQGYAFVKFDSKEAACKTIMEMNGGEMMGQTVRCSWGKVEGLPGATAAPAGRGAGLFNGPTAGAGAGRGAGAAGGGDAAFDPATLAAQQQYWSYYQQYYNNPQMQQQWANYYQQQGNQ